MKAKVIQYPTKAETGVIQEIDIENIWDCPFQKRTKESKEDLEGLADSIRSCGIIQPLIVRTTKGDAASGCDFELIAGHRRIMAAAMAGLKKVPCVVREASDQDARLANVVENLQRKDLTPLDEAEGVAELTDTLKKTAPEIAKMLGVSERWVFRRRKLAAIIPGWRAIIRNKKGGQEFCEALSRIPAALQTILLKTPATERLEVRQIGENLWEAGARDARLMPWAKEHPEWCGKCTKIIDATKGNEIEGAHWQLNGCMLCGDPACREAFTRKLIDATQERLKAKRLKPILVSTTDRLPPGCTNEMKGNNATPIVISSGPNAGAIFWADPNFEARQKDKAKKKADSKTAKEIPGKREELARIEAIHELAEKKGEDVISIRRALELVFLYILDIDEGKKPRGKRFLDVLNMNDQDLAKKVSAEVRRGFFIHLERTAFLTNETDPQEYKLEADQLATTFMLTEKDIEKKAREFLKNGKRI